MKHYNDPIEKALTMYTETVSPSKKNLHAILSQIPEQTKQEERSAIRSPYRWLIASQFVSLCLLLVAIYPAYTSRTDDPDYYFLGIDQEVAQFEANLNAEDYQATLDLQSQTQP